MKRTLSYYDVVNEIWEVYDHQFSYAAAQALADYYLELEEDIGEEIELDAIAIACEWNEYGDEEELLEYYAYVLNDDWDEEDDDEKLEAVLDYLRDNTDVIEFSGGYLVRAF